MITKEDVKQEDRRKGVPKKGILYYISQWKKLAAPSKKSAIVSISFYLIYISFTLLAAIFSAKVIDSLYLGEYGNACMWLAIDLLGIILRNVAMEIQYRAYSATYTTSFMKLQRALYRKMLRCKSEEFDQISKERVMNAIGIDCVNVANFYNNFFVTAAGRALLSIVSLIIIFVYNVYAGTIVLALGIADFFLLNFLNRKLGECNRKTYALKDKMFQNITTVVEGKSVINEFNQQNKFEKSYLHRSKEYCDSVARYYRWYSFRENGFFACWKTVLYLVTFILVYFVSQGLPIALYLIIVSYLSTCTENFNALFNTGKFYQDMRVSSDRINTILSLSDENMTNFGKNKDKISKSALNFVNVSYKNDDKSSEYSGTIKKINLSFKKNAINLIYGGKKCGKRVIFNILRRRIVPDDGVVLLDNIDISKFDDSVYKNYIFYVAGTPLFLHDTIMNNLLVANKKKKEIYQTCDKLGITEYIKALPNGFNTIVEDDSYSFEMFMLGVARALATNCKILCVYELPKGITEQEKVKIFNLFNELKKDLTIIIFRHNDAYSNGVDVKIHIADGEVKEIINEYEL